MYFMSKDQGCFCCEPRKLSYSQGMPSHQLHGQTLITTLPGSSKETNQPFSAQNILTNSTESSWLSVNNTCFNPTNEIEENNLHGNYMPDIGIHELEMCQIQDSNRMFMSDTESALTPDLGKHSPSFSFHILQNRELGAKISGNLVSEMKPLISSCDLSGCHFSSGRVFANGCDINVTKTNSADLMDLNCAVDELSMLSAVTNSQKEYLLETRGHASLTKDDKILHSKCKSSSNLTTLYHPNRYHILKMNSNFVASLNGTCVLNQTSNSYENSACKFEPSRLKYNNSNVLEEPTRHQRSFPRVSHMRKERYSYRKSRSPYKIPNRFCSSVQDSSSRPQYFSTCGRSFATSASISNNGVDTPPGRMINCQQLSESKSDTTSPIKSHIEVSLMRSLSVEDLTTMCRRLELELKMQNKASCDTEQNLDSVTDQMTDLHMS